MKVGDKVDISDSSVMYDADGEIIGETEIYWKVKVFNHQTMLEPWKEQKEEIKMFHKKGVCGLRFPEKGYTKWLNVGNFCTMTKKGDVVQDE